MCFICICILAALTLKFLLYDISSSSLCSISTSSPKFQVTSWGGGVPSSPWPVGLYNPPYRQFSLCILGIHTSLDSELHKGSDSILLPITDNNHDAYTKTCNIMNILKWMLNSLFMFSTLAANFFETYSWMAPVSWLVSPGFYCRNVC